MNNWHTRAGAAPLRSQGIVVLSITLIIMGVCALILASATLLIKEEARLQKADTDYQLAMFEAERIVKSIAEQIRLNVPTTDLDRQGYLVNKTTQVETARNGQSITIVNISVTHATLNVSVRQRFVYFPMLFSLPTNSVNTNNPALLETMFNTPLAKLTPTQFPVHVADTDCSVLPPSSIYWIVGNCVLPDNTLLGSPSAPVLLLIENGDLTFNENVTLHGLVVFFNNAPTSIPNTLTVSPTANIHGAVVGNRAISRTIMGAINFHGGNLQQLRDLPALLKSHPVQGSWYDVP